MVDEADELYGLPDAEFTPARDALAKRLRHEKRREEAGAVKALRRPSVAAGAINRAVREHGADDLLAAGAGLRGAHEALLSGDGDAVAVCEATARERDAVRDFARLALGDGASPSTEDKVRATLHAASIDDDVRELLVAGRLARDAEAGATRWPCSRVAGQAVLGVRRQAAPAGAKSRGSAGTKSGSSSGPKSDAPGAPRRLDPAAGRGRPRRNGGGRRPLSERRRRSTAR